MTSKEARQTEVVQRVKEIYAKLMVEQHNKQPGYWNDQVGRSTLSVASNWCEGIGYGTGTKSEARYFVIARGSAYEAALQFDLHGLTELRDMMDIVCDLIDSQVPEEYNAMSDQMLQPYIDMIKQFHDKKKLPPIEIAKI